MSHYLRLRIVPPELAEQVEQRTFLGVGTGVGRGSRLIEAAFITDADAPVVPPGCMCADLVDGTATVEIAVAGDIEMIADGTESPYLMVTEKLFHRIVTVTLGSGAMYDDEADRVRPIHHQSAFHLRQQGTLVELLAADGFYAKLYNSQFEGVET